MKKAYLAISKSNRENLNEEVAVLRHCLEGRSIELFVFVDNYKLKNNEESDMMTKAFKAIDDSDFIIAELSRKAIGVGIEIGYAYAKKKAILYIKQKETNYSTTAGGCSTNYIEYKNANHLAGLLEDALDQLIIE